MIFFFKQKTAYELRISDWSSDVCSSDLAYLAPDGFQPAVTADLRIALCRSASEHGMCPSVSHLFRSIPAEICPATVAALLTGMGKDGAQELRRLKENGAVTIVQDRSTAVVYGMPGEALRQDAAQFILSPDRKSTRLNSSH